MATPSTCRASLALALPLGRVLARALVMVTPTGTGKDIPRPGSAHPRINLRLTGERAARGCDVEVVVSRFEF